MKEKEEDVRDEKPSDNRSRLVVRKRKKKVHLSCDRTCHTCRTPCDNPFFPEQARKDKQ